MKETKGRRRKRLFVGMNVADLRLIQGNYKPGDKLIRGIKSEELDAEIERREAIAERTKGQVRAGGRFAVKERIGKGIREGIRDIPAEELERIHAAHETVAVKVCPKHGRGYSHVAPGYRSSNYCYECGAQLETRTVPGCCGVPWDVQGQFCVQCGSPRPPGKEEAETAEARPKWVDAIDLYRRLLREEPSEQKCEYFAKVVVRAIQEELAARSRNNPGLLRRLKRWLL